MSLLTSGGQILSLALSVAGFAVGGPYGTALVIAGMGVAFATSVAAKPKATSAKQTGREMEVRASRRPIPVIYGETWTDRVNKTFYHSANPYLHIIVELGEGPIEGILRQDGTAYTDTATALPRDNPPLVYLDDKLWTEYFAYERHNSGRPSMDDPRPAVYMEFYNGTATQAVCSTLQSASGGKWDQALRYTAYLYLRLEFSMECFKAEPAVSVKLRGLKVYDPATATTAWTQNPALCAYDYMTRSSQRGGVGVAAARIGETDLAAAVYYCAVKAWTCNLILDEQDAVADNLAHILACFRGDVIYSESVFKLRYRDLNYETVAMELTEDDVIATGGKSTLRIRQPDGLRPNTIRATWMPSVRKNKSEDYVFPDAAAVTADGDVREEATALYGMDSSGLVQKMCAYALERRRLNRESSAVVRERAIALEPMDLVQITHSLPGWEDQILRVTALGVTGDHKVALSMIEEDATFYDDVYNLTDQNWHDTTLLDPNAEPPDVILASMEEELYYYRGRSFTRLQVAFAPPSDYPWFAHVEVYVSTDSGVSYKHQFNASNSFTLDPVQEGIRYQVLLTTVNVFGRRQTGGVVLSKTVTGKTSAPSDLGGLSAIPAGDTVILAANPVTDPDVIGYEVRIGDSWAGGIFFAFNLDSRMTISNVRPGTHTFWMAAKNNAMVYSTHPVSATVTVFLPSGYTLANDWAWDFDGIGTHSNTEHITYNSQDALKCSHTATEVVDPAFKETDDAAFTDTDDAVFVPRFTGAETTSLTGTWVSPEYDLGSVKTVRIFGDFLCVFVSPAGLFSSIWGEARTFIEVDPQLEKTFSDLYAITSAGILRAKLKWGSVSGSLSNELDWFEITAPEVSARYVQVEITIVDPSADANLYLYALNMKAYTF